MKKIIGGMLLIGIGVLLWRLFDRDGRTKQTVKNMMDDVSLSIAENALPPSGDTSRNAVIRKAMLEQRERDNREWTASNINAHPDLYLAHCGETLSRYLKQYEDSILEVKVLMNQYRREISDAKEEIPSLMGFLKEAKVALSDKDRVYPSKVGLYTYPSADKVEASVRATDQKLTDMENTISIRTSQVERLQGTFDELAKGRDDVRRELRDIDRKREQAKAKNMQKSVEGLQARMNALLGGASVVAGEAEAEPGVAASKKDAKGVEDIFLKRGIE